jgi:NADP-dependent 3-hydroxy acid dehydrogenase YdfG
MVGKTEKTVVITGASSGIGLAAAEVYADQGYRLILGARRLERIKALNTDLIRRGATGVASFRLDVTQNSSITEFYQSCLTFTSKIDILVNNAGLAAGLAPVVSASDDDWVAMVNTNILGLARVTRTFLPHFIDRNEGHVVNIGSSAGFETYANGSVYAGTKHAVKAITGALRQELCGTAVRVSEIDPGMVETEFSLVRLKDKAKADAVYQGMTPLTARDVAETIYFVTSRPAHVNIDHLIVMPQAQASIHKVYRKT